ncbi:MAG: FAD-dependent oxidoreductase [Gemmatimonadota bacterium]
MPGADAARPAARDAVTLDPSADRLFDGAPWWLLRNGLREYPDVGEGPWDVAIVGAGITGAMLADTLTAAGRKVVIVDSRAPATGSTSASTALLLYELDTSLVELAQGIGLPEARRVYQLSRDAVVALGELASGLPVECGYSARESLYLAARRRHVDGLRAEAEARVAAGIPSEFLSAADVAADYGLDAPGALRSALAAVVDPVRLARALLDRALARGASIRTRSRVLRVENDEGGCRVVCAQGHSLLAEQVLLATGYESAAATRLGGMLHSTFALVTEPGALPPALARGTVIWESDRPYLYLRADDAGRVIIGGADLPFRNAPARARRFPASIRRLERALRRFHPDYHGPPAFSWAATFGEMPCGLPVIERAEGLPRVWRVLGYGGNGITFAMIATQLLAAVCLDRPAPDLALFRARR